MKVVAEAFDQDEFNRVTELLHSKGIPTISEGNSGIRRPYHMLIFVCLDDQFDDAATIIKYPSHTPKVQVSVDAFFRRAHGRNLDKILEWAIYVIVITAGLMVIAIRVLGNAA